MPSQRPLELNPDDALIIVDVQNDFLSGGSLPVPRGEEVVEILNRYAAAFQSKGLPIFATRDWHPPDHCSFKPYGGPWPVHCVAGSKGAGFAPGLCLPPSTRIVSKAVFKDREAYSGFDGTDLDSRLRALGVRRLFIGGLATDYCVLRSVQDALTLGYEAILLEDAVRAVNVHPGDGRDAEQVMIRAGAVLIQEKLLIP